MTKACPRAKWLIFFLKAESFYYTIQPNFPVLSASFHQAQSLMYSHPFLCPRRPFAYFHSFPGSFEIGASAE